MRGRSTWFAGAAGAAIVVLVAAVRSSTASPELVQGQVEVRRVNVAAKIPGRVAAVLVEEGDVVIAGQLLAVLHSPELEAKARQAEAAVEAARAQEQKARHGARLQEVDAAQANWERAQAAEQLAAATYERVQRLFLDGVIAEQKRDEAHTQLAAARLTTRAARAQYELAREGARAEDRTSAAAVLRQAEGGRAEVEAYAAERRVLAPVAGEVALRSAEAGEIVGAGVPIVSIAEVDEPWITFNVREDRLARITAGDTLSVRIPALGDRVIATRITYIAPLADFATWRATRETGGFDLRTFEIRAKPLQRVQQLRAGMSALLVAERLIAR